LDKLTTKFKPFALRENLASKQYLILLQPTR